MISVLIPVKDGGHDLVRCLEAIATQDVDDSVEVVVVDSGSVDGSPDRARSLGAIVHEIPATEFVHGATRNLAARLSSGDVLVFTSQDAVAADRHWLRLLTAALAGPGIAGAYGRQLPHEGARPPDQFFLDFMYGPEPRTQTLSHVDDLTYEQTLFSNVNSAIPRQIWEAAPFADDVVMSEDQEWSRRMLLAGHTIVYEPRAAVRHSHDYSLREAFTRFYASGASADRSYVAGAGSSAALRRAAGRYAVSEFRWLWQAGHKRWIPFAAVYELSKAVGLTLGRHGPRLKVESERIAEDAKAPKWVRNEHLARYAFAARYATGAVVVDCACGDGTCARTLAKAAREIHGFDLSADAIGAAKRKNLPNASFAVADACALPLEAAVADLYVSLETIEHLDDAEAFLSEVVRVLRPGGSLVCSTPDRDVYSPGASAESEPWNRFHRHEFTQAAFVALLGRYFGQIELFGQNPKSPAVTRLRGTVGRLTPGQLVVRATQASKLPRLAYDRFEHHLVVPADPRRRYEILTAHCTQPLQAGR